MRKVSRKQLDSKRRKNCCLASIFKTVWPSGLRRWLQAPVRKGVGSNPTAVTLYVQHWTNVNKKMNVR